MHLTFSPIRLEDQARYLEYLAKTPQRASDYSFVNLLGWAQEYDLEIAFGEHCVWIRQKSPSLVYWAPVGNWDAVAWGECPLTEQGMEMIRVPETLLEIMKKHLGKLVQVHSARGHWDYIYSVPELVALEGKRLSRKRHHLEEFMQRYNWVYKEINADCIEDALQMQQEWCEWRECKDSDALIMENHAIARVMQNWDAMDTLIGGTLHVDGEMVAYTVAEPLDDTTLVVHFEKGKPEYEGVYQAINQLFLADKGGPFTWVNREQDLDDPGLRRAKLSYYPADFLKKYTVTLLPA